MSKISVAIADDNERMVSLIKEILSEDSDIEIVGTADNGLDALGIIEEKEPHENKEKAEQAVESC